jgi:hypothetical protein
MALIIKNSKDLLKPEDFRLKILIFGDSGLGKTEFASTAPNPGVVAIETGHGQGLLTVAEKGLNYVTPANYAELEEGLLKTFEDKETIVLDSLTAATKTFIKDRALQIPRMKGESDKRKIGIPELDDYGSMGELTRRLMSKLLVRQKHIIVTALSKYKQPDPETGVGQAMTGPDLPGEMFTAAPGMFDVVLRLMSRKKLRDPKDAKSSYVERYFITDSDGQGGLAKSRLKRQGLALLDREEVFDLTTGAGTFPKLLEKVLAGYAKGVLVGK